MDYILEDCRLEADECAQRSAHIWADLAFDGQAKASLKRDGLDLRELRLTGAMPWRFEAGETGHIRVVIEPGPHAGDYLDLFRLWFIPRLKKSGPQSE